MRYRNKKNNKIVTYIKQIDNDIYFIIDGIETILDVSTFNANYEPFLK